MPEHSETTPIMSTVRSTQWFTQLDSAETGLQIVAAFAAKHRLQDATWIVTTTIGQDDLEDWHVQVTKVATP